MGAPNPLTDVTAAPARREAAAGFDSLSPLRQTLYPHTYDKAAVPEARMTYAVACPAVTGRVA